MPRPIKWLLWALLSPALLVAFVYVCVRDWRYMLTGRRSAKRGAP